MPQSTDVIDALIKELVEQVEYRVRAEQALARHTSEKVYDENQLTLAVLDKEDIHRQKK